jgi:hypothetical protein
MRVWLPEQEDLLFNGLVPRKDLICAVQRSGEDTALSTGLTACMLPFTLVVIHVCFLAPLGIGYRGCSKDHVKLSSVGSTFVFTTVTRNTIVRHKFLLRFLLRVEQMVLPRERQRGGAMGGITAVSNGAADNGQSYRWSHGSRDGEREGVFSRIGHRARTRQTHYSSDGSIPFNENSDARLDE